MEQWDSLKHKFHRAFRSDHDGDEVPLEVPLETLERQALDGCVVCQDYLAFIESQIPASAAASCVVTGRQPESPLVHLCGNFRQSDHLATFSIVPKTSIPDGRTDSETMIHRIRRCMHDCDRTHGCLGATTSFMPKRLVDVGVASDSVRVVRPSRRKPYVTLSHCWGPEGTMSVRLTEASKPALYAGVRVAELPRTFRDAVFVTRKLGQRYIWIDSLCVVQPPAQGIGNTEDWEEQAPLMGKIYSNSALNISASCSASSREGLFRDLRSFKPSRLRGAAGSLCKTHQHYQNPENGGGGGGRGRLSGLDDASFWFSVVREEPAEAETLPLLRRGWAFQEHVLPVRSLSFLAGSVVFRCQERTESFPPDLDARVIAQLQPYRSMVADQEHWNLAIRRFHPLNFTRPADRLPAVAGLAQIARERNDWSYLAGLWEDSLLQGLSWIMDSPGTAVDRWTAPSWSWASVRGGHYGGPSLGVVDTAETATSPDSSLAVVSLPRLWVNKLLGGTVRDLAQSPLVMRGRFRALPNGLPSPDDPDWYPDVAGSVLSRLPTGFACLEDIGRADGEGAYFALRFARSPHAGLRILVVLRLVDSRTSPQRFVRVGILKDRRSLYWDSTELREFAWF